jgi:hypothetical protein
LSFEPAKMSPISIAITAAIAARTASLDQNRPRAVARRRARTAEDEAATEQAMVAATS